MHPILEDEPEESGSWVALPSATTLQGAAPDCVPMDTMSEASTDISSSMSELESVDSENNCKYFFREGRPHIRPKGDNTDKEVGKAHAAKRAR